MDEASTDQQDESQQQKMESLAQAFEMFTKTTASLESAYELLEQRVQSLDAELQAKNRELELTTEYLNSILDSMSDGVVVVDPDNRVTTFNHAAASVLGIDPAEATGQSCDAVMGESFTQGSGLRELELRTADDAPVPVTVKSSPIVDKDGADIGTVTVFQDMREIEALRQQVRHRDRLAAIGEMAATVAHEIRNPLGGIQGFASLLLRDVEEDSPQYRLVEKIVTGTKNLNRVVSALLEYTRPVEMEPGSIDGHELIASAMAYCPLEGDSISIENRVPKGLSFRGDAHLLRQVFLNLLINAVQSIETEGSVCVEVSEEDSCWAFRVSDTGSGISEEDLKQVFMPFFTTKEKGTGLGLAAAQKTVQAHGGSLRVESEVDNGTTFIVSIPRGV